MPRHTELIMKYGDPENYRPVMKEPQPSPFESRITQGARMKSLNPRVEALRKTAKFLLCVSKGAPASAADFKTFSDLCWLQVPMKYRMDKAERDEVYARPWLDEPPSETAQSYIPVNNSLPRDHFPGGQNWNAEATPLAVEGPAGPKPAPRHSPKLNAFAWFMGEWAAKIRNAVVSR